ncbi:OmpA family protein, partial [Bacteroidota bacterium]
FSNINPVVNYKESAIVYISKEKFQDMIFFSRKKDTLWTFPMNITPQVGSDGDMYPTALNANANQLLLYRDDNLGGDIYISYFSDELNIWSKAQPLNENINTRYWETHACFSPNGNTIYFTSNRKGGQGGLDIYKSRLDESGDWGEAMNLGPVINTRQNEETPFMIEDSRTLFFSSQGHYNIGGYDIFKATITDEGNWSRPINLGYPISTTDDDLFFCPVQNGSYAYYSTFDENGFGGNDIVRIKLSPKEIKEKITIKGSLSLIDNVTEFDESFKIMLINAETNETIDSISPDVNDGSYLIEVTKGKYRLKIISDEYESLEENLIIPEDFNRDSISLISNLSPKTVSLGIHLVVKSIYFNFDKFDLTRDARIELEKLLVVMKKFPELLIEIVGHTDSWGSYEYNLWLSKNRADTVINYLVGRGVNRDRFISRALGETSPVAINTNPDGTDSPEGRRYNRRVDIKVVNSPDNKVITDAIYIPEHLRLDRAVYYYILIAKSEGKLTNKQVKYLEQLEIGYHIEQIDNIFYYYYGTFDEKSEALYLFNNIISLGFENAEIINNYDLEKLGFN